MIYFDNAATTYPKPDIVYCTMDNFYRNYGFSAGRGQYPQTVQVSKVITDTREKLKKLFNCLPHQEVVFTSSATEAINIILQGIDWSKIKNVYITHFEHNAVLRVLHQIKNININYIKTEKEVKNNKVSLSFDLENIKYQFQDNKPDLVVMTHASNVCGLVVPIEEIASLAKEYDAYVVVDCAQTAGLLNINFNKLRADHIIFAGHKTLYGPLGIAGFTVSNKSNLKPLMYGGTGVDSANMELPIEIPQKFEVGSQNTYAIAGLNASLDWIDNIGRVNIENKEKKLFYDMLSVFEQYPNITVFSSASKDKQLGILSCTFEDYQSGSIGQVLSQNNIAVRTGLHCAPEAHKFMGTSPGGTVRFSLGYFNDNNDIIKLNNIIEQICYS
ncbi:aminotransferase class V-fold PLP-dependent enzyme [Herbivorax sp. ANBcel31]|uniref:aminotransferase class V-fold PLP-dependent enzyme n=1 Tax=Herbivorax sp. ANBcel31 TaxID=3069754 RepID=UPI0027B4478C|nr:aminotransferase class V-fold PLP-dependent enzyme [Herbivorax sp. ANBcel31]MDQ2087093.1 aminotransferase class V-fold PLP-dependent enzyme [Herbivorax sp. ANBcel31]